MQITFYLYSYIILAFIDILHLCNKREDSIKICDYYIQFQGISEISSLSFFARIYYNNHYNYTITILNT